MSLFQVCLAKVNCGGPVDSVVTQDLLLGEGQGVENGDSLEVAYSGWLLQNHTIGQVKMFINDHVYVNTGPKMGMA